MRIAIASGKGGTGKTTVSTNLASRWALSRPVVLVDLDVEEPNAALFLDSEPVTSKRLVKAVPQWNSENCLLCGQCQDVCEFNAVMKIGSDIMVFPELCHSCHACSELCPSSSLPMQLRDIGELQHRRKNGMDFIEGRLAVGEEQAVPAIKQTLSYLRELVDGPAYNRPSDGGAVPGRETIVILDSPPGTSCPVVEVIKNADFVILVTEPTPFGLFDLSLAVDLVRSMGKPFAVVINRDGVGDDAVDRYCRDEQIRVIARIPQSRMMAEAYSSGKLLYQDFPEMETALSDIVSFLEKQQTEKVS